MDMKDTEAARTNNIHSATCSQRGFRYAATIRSNKTTKANGTAGKVVMICKTSGCPALLVL